MDSYRDYIQTTSDSEVHDFKKKGYQVVNIHTSVDSDRNERTVFTLGLSYETAYLQLMSLVKDIEKGYSKEDIFRLVAKQLSENYEEYSKNSFFETKNDFTEWITTYDRLVHDEKSTYYKEKQNNYDV